MPSTRTETITAADGGTFTGHLTLPDSGHGAGVLLLQEIFGVGDFLKAKANDLAELGYVVLCPDVFWRIQPNIALAHDEDALQEAFGYMTRYMEEVPEETKTADLGAALDHLRSRPEVAGQKVAAMGYCLGGHLAFAIGCHFSPDAVVSYYGSGIVDRLSEAETLTCPVIFHFGGNDLDRDVVARDCLERERGFEPGDAAACDHDVEARTAHGWIVPPRGSGAIRRNPGFGTR